LKEKQSGEKTQFPGGEVSRLQKEGREKSNSRDAFRALVRSSSRGPESVVQGGRMTKNLARKRAGRPAVTWRGTKKGPPRKDGGRRPTKKRRPGE